MPNAILRGVPAAFRLYFHRLPFERGLEAPFGDPSYSFPGLKNLNIDPDPEKIPFSRFSACFAFASHQHSKKEKAFATRFSHDPVRGVIIILEIVVPFPSKVQSTRTVVEHRAGGIGRIPFAKPEPISVINQTAQRDRSGGPTETDSHGSDC